MTEKTTETIQIYSSLKNADLTCISAKSAITGLLNFTQLKGLKRYKVFSFDVDNANKELINKTFQELLDNSYILANPNKEESYLENLPKTETEQTIFHLTVFPKKKIGFDQVIKKVAHKTRLTIKSLEVSTLWELSLEDSNSNTELEKDLVQKVILNTSIKNGLLVHPLSEDYVLKKL